MPSHAPEHSTAPNTPNYQAPMGLDSYLQVTTSNADLSHPSPSIPRSQPPPPQQQQYSYQHPSGSTQSAAQIRFIDSNPRPSKSPRHVAPPELPAVGAYNDYPAR